MPPNMIADCITLSTLRDERNEYSAGWGWGWGGVGVGVGGLVTGDWRAAVVCMSVREEGGGTQTVLVRCKGG